MKDNLPIGSDAYTDVVLVDIFDKQISGAFGKKSSKRSLMLGTRLRILGMRRVNGLMIQSFSLLRTFSVKAGKR